MLSRIQLFATPWTVTYQAPLSVGFSMGFFIGVGCHFLLQGIFLTQGLNLGLQHCRRMLYPLIPQGSPRLKEDMDKTPLERVLRGKRCDSRVPALTRNFLDLTFQGASGNVHLLVATGEGSRNKHRRRDVEFLFLEVVRLRLGFYNFCNMLTSI